MDFINQQPLITSRDYKFIANEPGVIGVANGVQLLDQEETFGIRYVENIYTTAAGTNRSEIARNVDGICISCSIKTAYSHRRSGVGYIHHIESCLAACYEGVVAFNLDLEGFSGNSKLSQ